MKMPGAIICRLTEDSTSLPILLMLFYYFIGAVQSGSPFKFKRHATELSDRKVIRCGFRREFPSNSEAPAAFPPRSRGFGGESSSRGGFSSCATCRTF